MIIRALVVVLAFSLPAAAAATLPAPPPPRPEQVMAVPPALQAQFRQLVTRLGGSQAQRLQRMVDFLFRDSGLAMQYRHDATHTVEQAYQTRTGNCLTFTMLAVALAREAGLEAYGQEIDESLGWYREGDKVYRTVHVNAGVLLQRRQRFSVDVASDSVMTRHPPQSVSDQRLLAHYYNNRAAELIGDGQRAAATGYVAMSLRLDPGFATSWSNAGVFLMHDGDLAAAQHHYARALALDPTHPATLFNLAALYRHTGDRTRARALTRRLEKAQIQDPFHQFLLAADYEKQGNHALALKHYQRAIALHDGEHRFHFGLARTYLQLGDVRRAQKALTRAEALSEGDTRSVYVAKLDSLRLRGK